MRGSNDEPAFVRAVAAKLREDFHLSCDAALDAMAACDVVEGDLLDPTFRGAHAANVAAKEAARAEAEKAAREAGLTGRRDSRRRGRRGAHRGGFDAVAVHPTRA